MEFQTYWAFAFLVLGTLTFSLIIGFGLKNAGSTTLKRFISSFEKDFPKNSIITDHALVRFEEHRYNRAKWETNNAIRSAIILGLSFIGLALSPYIGGMIEDWDGSLRVAFVLGIVVFIIMGAPELAEKWFKEYRFDEAKHQNPQWEYMEQVAARYGVNLDANREYQTNLTHLRTSIEVLAFKAPRDQKGTVNQ